MLKLKRKSELTHYVESIDLEFFECIKDLIQSKEVQSLINYKHHKKMNRLEHVLNVAYYSYQTAKHLNLDYRSTARGALLHDLYFYDEDAISKPWGLLKHLRSHPKLALKNATERFELNEIEQDIIVKHMFLVTLTPPRYAESLVVSSLDKFCAIQEVLNHSLVTQALVDTFNYYSRALMFQP